MLEWRRKWEEARRVTGAAVEGRPVTGTVTPRLGKPPLLFHAQEEEGRVFEHVAGFAADEALEEGGIGGEEGEFAAEVVEGGAAASGGEEVEFGLAVEVGFDEGAEGDFVGEFEGREDEGAEGVEAIFELVGLFLLGAGEVGGFGGTGVVLTFGLGFVARGVLARFLQGVEHDGVLLLEDLDDAGEEVGFGHFLGGSKVPS